MYGCARGYSAGCGTDRGTEAPRHRRLPSRPWGTAAPLTCPSRAGIAARHPPARPGSAAARGHRWDVTTSTAPGMQQAEGRLPALPAGWEQHHTEQKPKPAPFP